MDGIAREINISGSILSWCCCDSVSSKIITFAVASLVYGAAHAISPRVIFFTLIKLLPRVDIVVREYDVML